MGILTRIKKKEALGFMGFVMSLETTPRTKVQEIIQAGTMDDPVYMEWAKKNVLTVDQIAQLDAGDLIYLIKEIPGTSETVARAFYKTGKAEKLLKERLTPVELRDHMRATEDIVALRASQRENAQFMVFQKLRELQGCEIGNESFGNIKWDLPPTSVLTYQGKMLDDGKWAFNYEDGSKSSEGPMRDFMRHGVWDHYYRNGATMAHGCYVKDERHGNWELWYADGKKMAEGEYSHDKRCGVWKHWKPDGSFFVIDFGAKEVVTSKETAQKKKAG